MKDLLIVKLAHFEIIPDYYTSTNGVFELITTNFTAIHIQRCILVRNYSEYY